MYLFYTHTHTHTHMYMYCFKLKTKHLEVRTLAVSQDNTRYINNVTTYFHV